MYAKAFVSLAFAAFSIASVHARVQCDNKFVIETKPLELPSGQVLTVERFNCSNSIEARQEAAAMNKRTSDLDLFNTILRRASPECTTSNCICGVPCFFDLCEATTQTIKATDCQNLANSLINTPGTLTIPPGQAIAFILNSCEIAAFGTSSTIPTQYCFNDMGVAASQVFHVCGANMIGACSGTLNGATFFVDQLPP